MASIAATPEKAPYPAPAYLKLGAKEMSDAMFKSMGKECTQGLCDIPVQVGIFFDGTNNHMERDRDGKRVPVPWTDKELAQAKAQARREGRNPKDVTGPPPMPRVSTQHTQQFNSIPESLS